MNYYIYVPKLQILFFFDTFFWILSSLLLTLTIMAAVVGITYTLLHLSGSTPDLSNITGVIGGSARSSQTSETAQGNTNKEIKNQLSNAGTDHMNQTARQTANHKPAVQTMRAEHGYKLLQQYQEQI